MDPRQFAVALLQASAFSPQSLAQSTQTTLLPHAPPIPPHPPSQYHSRAYPPLSQTLPAHPGLPKLSPVPTLLLVPSPLPEPLLHYHSRSQHPPLMQKHPLVQVKPLPILPPPPPLNRQLPLLPNSASLVVLVSACLSSHCSQPTDWPLSYQYPTESTQSRGPQDDLATATDPPPWSVANTPPERSYVHGLHLGMQHSAGSSALAPVPRQLTPGAAA